MSMRVGNSSSFIFMGCLHLDILTSPILYATAVAHGKLLLQTRSYLNTILLNVLQNCSKNFRISFATRLSSNSRERME